MQPQTLVAIPRGVEAGLVRQEQRPAGAAAGKNESSGIAERILDQCTSAAQNTENRIAAFIIEHKASHKLSLGYIYEGLNDMELKDFRQLIAAVIMQAFSYMVKIGLEYGCVCTGKAIIFLWVPDNPRAVRYFLSVPKGDVGGNTG
ncbi:hypothetical protein AOQ84DRAFT_225949 [Glonium stellatum]|uniref:Uncharacterized protein n=1 Tax=Glonium stellatum TaxID=574774 RepID=A0A8E2ET76_9PEZI|nr:hypothetical protein AOQ84DRAFT_225949 [Glonium stellatum]